MPKPLVTDELWTVVEPLLPKQPPKPKGGRPRVNDRAALTGILFVLKTGVLWEMLPQEMGYGSGMTCSASIVASMQGEVGRGEVLAREAVELAEQSGDRAGRVWTLLMLSFAERCRGDHQAAASHAEAAVGEAWTLDDDDLPPFLRAFAFNRLGHEAYELGNWSRAEAVLQEALERWRRLGSPWGIGVVLGKRADVAQARGNAALAAALYRESLDSWWSQGELGAVELLTGVARLAAKNQPERAVRLFATAEAIQTRIGLTLALALRAKNERALAAAQAELGQEAFDAAWSAGGNLSLEQAAAEARTVTVDAGPGPPPQPAA